MELLEYLEYSIRIDWLTEKWVTGDIIQNIWNLEIFSKSETGWNNRNKQNIKNVGNIEM